MRDPLAWLRSPDLVPAAPVARVVLDCCARNCYATLERCCARRFSDGCACLSNTRSNWTNAWNQPLPNRPRLVPDACWPEAGLVVEVDSRSWHGFGDAPERTERRRALLAGLGWRVLPIAPARIRREPQAVLMEIERAYATGIQD